mmetsp:Transcript_139757/g.243272  ORF Transcript_139757/g.243272 Transcript_139757/m.243272 type:complete len:232 (+) Transcript_139757:756-1451(+)
MLFGDLSKGYRQRLQPLQIHLAEEPLGVHLADFVVAQLGEHLCRDEGLQALGTYVPYLFRLLLPLLLLRLFPISLLFQPPLLRLFGLPLLPLLLLLQALLLFLGGLLLLLPLPRKLLLVPLQTWIKLVGPVREAEDALVLRLLQVSPLLFILLLHPPLLVTALSVLRVVGIHVGELTPAAEVVPELVELLDLLDGGVHVPQPGHLAGRAPAGVAVEALPKLLEEVLHRRLG